MLGEQDAWKISALIAIHSAAPPPPPGLCSGLRVFLMLQDLGKPPLPFSPVLWESFEGHSLSPLLHSSLGGFEFSFTPGGEAGLHRKERGPGASSPLWLSRARSVLRQEQARWVIHTLTNIQYWTE